MTNIAACTGRITYIFIISLVGIASVPAGPVVGAWLLLMPVVNLFSAAIKHDCKTVQGRELLVAEIAGLICPAGVTTEAASGL